MPAKRVVQTPGTSPAERGTIPLRIHKNVVISFLRQYPEDFRKIAPDFPGEVEEYIAELERRPGQWFVGDTLEEEPAP